jgi:hypothetical protein
MTTSKPRLTGPIQAFRAVVAVGVLLVLGANLPGHMSYDSVAQLREGRLGVRETWGPAFYAWVLGAFDRLSPGVGLYVAASAAVFGASLLLLRSLRPRTSWAAAPVAAGVMLTPQVLIYQAIVWKDVMFANCAVAGFVLVACAVRRWEDRAPRLAALAAAALVFAAGALVRQNGAIVIPFAALALAWSARTGGRRRAWAWAAGWLLLVFVLIKGLGLAAESQSNGPDVTLNRGVRILQHYDLIGSAAAEPRLQLGALAAVSPRHAQIVRAATRAYSPERVEALDAAPEVAELWRLPDAAVGAQWRAVLLHQPGAYLHHRWNAFRWVAAPPDLGRCLPVQVGISAPPELVASLGISGGNGPRDDRLRTYAARFYDTPLYSHVSFALLALGVMVAALVRRDAADIVIAAMMAAALAFAASFLVVSIACDYRYLYFLDLAALVGVIYLALDPTFRRAQREISASRAA